VILEEVARGWPIFGAGDALARIQQRLDLPYRYEPAADGQFGNAILSRLPMAPVAAGRLPDVPGKQPRSYLAVRIDAGGGRPVLVVAAHLETDDVAQIEALLDVWGGASPAIVAGDLNMQPDDVGRADVGLRPALMGLRDPRLARAGLPDRNDDRLGPPARARPPRAPAAVSPAVGPMRRRTARTGAGARASRTAGPRATGPPTRRRAAV
jgi:endonuclease/exonuclease/phosphatase family metal-dependent hydrolase